MVQSGEFLRRLIRPILRTGLSLMKNALKLLAKSILVPLRLIEVLSVADAGIHKKS